MSKTLQKSQETLSKTVDILEQMYSGKMSPQEALDILKQCSEQNDHSASLLTKQNRRNNE